jgi:hypothetical protein
MTARVIITVALPDWLGAQLAGHCVRAGESLDDIVVDAVALHLDDLGERIEEDEPLPVPAALGAQESGG